MGPDPPDLWGLDEDVPLTILFADVVGSTAMQTAHGDVEARAAIAALEVLMRSAVDEHGGRMIKLLGDGMMAVFRSPRKGVACAMSINRSLEIAPPTGVLGVRVRSGVHTGEVIPDGQGDYHGVAVSAAARICNRAGGGEVLVSDVTRQLCGSVTEIAFEERHARVTLKGLPERWRLLRAVPVVAPTGVADGELPFVGREAIRGELRDLMSRATAGHGTIVMIGGEPGIGKSRLGRELSADAAARGLEVFVGNCHEQGDIPYMPWVEMVRAGARGVDAETLAARYGPQVSALAQMAPELRERLPDLPPAPDVPAAEQRWYLFDSVVEYLRRISTGAPRVLILEDMHWADDSTLSLLEHLATSIADLPMLVLATHRDSAAEVSERLAETLARLARVPAARVVSLTRLSRPEVGALLAALGGGEPPTAVVEAIYERTGGNAFFVEESFRDLVESGRLLDERGGFRADIDLDALEVPSSVRLVIEQRLQRLPGPVRAMLTVAAVLGRGFDFRVLELCCDGDADAVLDGIEEAERAQLVVEDCSAAEPRYQFTHELVRQALLEGLSGPRRQRYHARAADALERIFSGQLDLHAAEIASHLLASGHRADPLRVVAHLTRAGDAQLSAAAFAEALRAYEQAEGLLPQEPAQARADTLAKLAMAHRSLGHWDRAVARWLEAIELLQRVGEVDACAELCWELSEQLIWAYRFGELGEVLSRGLAVLGEDPSPYRSRLVGMMGLLLTLTGDYEAGAAQLAAAAELAEGDDELARAQVWQFQALRHYFLMQYPELIEAGTRACDELRTIGGADWRLADGLSLNPGFTFSGRFAEGEAVEREAESLARRLGNWAALSAAYRCKFALAAAQRGDLAELRGLAEEQLRLARDTDSPGWLAYARTLSGVVSFWEGNWETAVEQLEAGVELAMPFWFGVHHGALLLVCAHTDRAAAVAERLDRLEAALPRSGSPNLVGAWSLAIMASEAAAVCGLRDRAAALYVHVEAAIGHGAVMRQLDGRLIETVAGQAAACAGQLSAAKRHFETALLQAEQLPHRLERPHVRHAYGRFLIELGESDRHDRGLQLLQEAIDDYALLGMARHERAARELLTDGRTAAKSGQPALRLVK
jgi:class 3 adenylate cyclase